MAYEEVNFGSVNQFKAYLPDDVFNYAFSPYYIEITGTTVNQEVKLTFMRTTDDHVYYIRKRFTDSANKARFPLSDVYRSCFNNVDFGNILSASNGYLNSKSKLFSDYEYKFEIQVGSDSGKITPALRISYGAIQQSEIEKINEYIFAFKGDNGHYLPLTITDKFSDIGKEVWISDKFNTDGHVSDIELNVDNILVKKYNVSEIQNCGGYYLRWVYNGEYKYFLFQEGVISDELKDGNSMDENIWSLESDNNVFKCDSKLISKSGNETIDCGVKSATYEMQLHLLGLQRSIMQWMYIGGGKWQEIKIKMTPIQIDRFKSKKEINLTIIKQSLFIESL